MPKTTNTSNLKKNDETVQTIQKESYSNNEEIINQLMKKIEELTRMVNESKEAQKLSENSSSLDNCVEEFKEPNPNKQIRLISLCYGALNLSTEPFGKGKLVSFSKYGESKTILYSTLIDIVNNNRKFAENGSFYILDKDAVYYLGLSDFYKNILSKDIMDNIYNYSPAEINDLLRSATEEQKEVIVRNTIDKIYNNIPVDLNKADVIGKSCGVDIMSKVSEMKEIDSSIRKSK